MQLMRWRPLAVVIVGVVLSLSLFEGARRLERARLQAQFDQLASDRLTALSNELRDSLNRVAETASFFQASEAVTREEFRRFTDAILSQRTRPLAIGWGRP